MQEMPPENKKKLVKSLVVLVFILCLYFGVKVLAEFRAYQMMGSGTEPSVITLSGHGEVTAVPDIASVYFSITKDAKTVKEAQNSVALIEKQALDLLKKDGVAEADVQVSNASFNPKYEFQASKTLVPCTIYGCPPPQGNSVIVGYTASESITVKIRNTDNVGTIMQGLGTVGVTDLNGPNFTIDKPEVLQAQARKKAIDDAEAKAKALARDLGVRLGKINSFNESGNYPTPIMYGKAMALDASAPEAAPAQIPKGENTISSDVTITYDIR